MKSKQIIQSRSWCNFLCNQSMKLMHVRLNDMFLSFIHLTLFLIHNITWKKIFILEKKVKTDLERDRRDL